MAVTVVGGAPALTRLRVVFQGREPVEQKLLDNSVIRQACGQNTLRRFKVRINCHVHMDYEKVANDRYWSRTVVIDVLFSFFLAAILE